jgi:hypothetical protein
LTESGKPAGTSRPGRTANTPSWRVCPAISLSDWPLPASAKNTSGALVATSTLPDASAVTAAGPCATVTVLASMPASLKKPFSTASSTSVVTSVFGCTVKRTVIAGALCAYAWLAVAAMMRASAAAWRNFMCAPPVRTG